MKYILFFILSFIAAAQTRVVYSQIPWQQTDESFFRQCIFNADGSYANAYAYLPIYPHGLTSSSKTPSTYLRMSQINGYGIAATRNIMSVMGLWAFQSANTTATGTLEWRTGMSTPNFNLVGVLVTDITEISNRGGWATINNGNYSLPPLATLTLQNGLFTVMPSTTVFHNTCELWDIGTFTDIPPNP